MDDNAQFYALEGIIAIGMILLSLIFVYSLSGESVVNPEASTQLKNLAEEALYILRNTEPDEEEIPASSDCVGRWDFEEGDGPAIDTSGNGYDGVISGCVYSSYSVHGEYSMYFDGNSDEIVCNNIPELDILSGFTLSAWIVCEDDTIGETYFLSKGDEFALGISGTAIPVLRWNDGSDNQFFYGQTTLEPQTWYHITATFDGLNVEIYVNGGINTDGPYYSVSSPDITGENFKIGVYNTWDFKGKIDNVCIWDRALNDDEILASYYLGINSVFQNKLTQWIITNDDQSKIEFQNEIEKILPANVFYQVKLFDGINTYKWIENDKDSIAEKIVKSRYLISHGTRMYSVELEIWTL